MADREIPVSDQTYKMLDELRADSESWDELLTRLARDEFVEEPATPAGDVEGRERPPEDFVPPKET